MKKKQKNLYKFIVILTILISTYVIVAYFLTIFPFNGAEEVKKTDLPLETVQHQPRQSPSDKKDHHAVLGAAAENAKKPVQNDGIDPNQLPSITGAVNNKSIDRQHQILIIRVTIDQFLASAGKCELILTNQQQTLTEKADTVDNPSSTTCQGFDVPLQKLNSGKWLIKIKINSNDGKMGEIDGGEIEL